MVKKKHSGLGRRSLPKAEKKRKIIVFVKAKNHAKAKSEIMRLAGIYNSEKSNTEI